MMKLLVCSLTLTALVVGNPAPGHYLIETEDEPLLDAGDNLAKMGKVVEKGSKDVMDAIEGEKTDGEIIEKGKDDFETGEDYCIWWCLCGFCGYLFG